MTQVPARVRSWTREGPYAQGMRSGRWGSVLRGVVLAYGTAGIEMPTDILQLEGSDSLATALRSALEEPG